MPNKSRSPTRLSGMTSLLGGSAWAIREGDHRQLVSAFNHYLRAGPAGSEQLDQLRAMRESRAADLGQAQETAGGIAILPLYGTIVPRGDLMVEYCGAASPHHFADAVSQAAQDPNIASIILDIDSGGGTVSGIDVAYEAVRRASALKPVTAMVNTMCCSAAYWIASAAREIVITPAGEAGSIGVIGTHVDESAALDDLGLKVTYVRSTPGKALGQPTEAMDGAVLDSWQSEVDRLHTLFIEAIAQGRSRSAADVRATWATGEVWFGQEAVNAGLADRVGTLGDVIGRHMQDAQQQQARQARKGRAASEGLRQMQARVDAMHALAGLSPEEAGVASLITRALYAELDQICCARNVPDELAAFQELRAETAELQKRFAGLTRAGKAFQAGDGPEYEVGTRVKITVPPHMDGHDTGEVREAVMTYAYGIVFDGMEDMGVHHWYVESELQPEDPNAAGPEADPTSARKKKKKMPGMGMEADMAIIKLKAADGTLHEIENTQEAVTAFLAQQQSAAQAAVTEAERAANTLAAEARTTQLAQIGALFALTPEQATGSDLAPWEAAARSAAAVSDHRSALLAELEQLAVTVDGNTGAATQIVKLAGAASLTDLTATVTAYRDRRDALVPNRRSVDREITEEKEEAKPPARKPNYDRN